jgi:VWFA-related protein
MEISPHNPRRFRTSLLGAVCFSLFLSAKPNPQNAGQQTAQSPPANSSSQDSASEMAVKDEATTAKVAEAAKFRVNVRLVLARVVVRDSNGHAIGNLHKEDFELFDNGKQQVISAFDAQAASEALSEAPPNATAENNSTNIQTTPAFPARYVALVFDDLRLDFANLSRVRDAAEHRIDNLVPTERVAVFSTSGQTTLDFTDDRAKLRQTVDSLRPHPIQMQGSTQCPDISLYMADLIVNKNDPNALQTAINDYMYCSNAPPQAIATAGPLVQGMASQILNVGEEESRMALRVLNGIVRRMAALPGQRSLVLVSPGFLTPDLQYDYNELIDNALRGQVIVNSIDARGLYTVIPGGDASQAGRPDLAMPGQRNAATPQAVLATQSASAESDILSVLAYSTGGKFFHNNNDLNEGFRQIAQGPEFWYVLGFAPQNLKTDGKFHTLKVSLTSGQKYDLESRRGYYAPRQALDSAEEAKREIEDEVFSNEELHDLPLMLHTQFFKPSEDAAKLTVLAHIDVKHLRYKQSADRNQNDLTVVTAVFDRNGNFLQANQKFVQMRWKSETLQAKLGSGITLKSSFDVKPGRYLVRVVARDTEQQGMSAESGAVEIP